MVIRLINPSQLNSFFVFGARGTGKSYYLNSVFKNKQAFFFNLLDDEDFDRLLTDPKILDRLSQEKKYEWIVIDEIQRLPNLLNRVHKLIESSKQKFILTGSSARKLKRGAANLLAGRAFVYYLFPFSYLELGDKFDLDQALHWGTLPKIFDFSDTKNKEDYLRSYCLTYLKEEIIAEQAVRNLEPFRDFLEIAAQHSGKIINFSSIAKNVGVQIPTVQNYFDILCDTHMGFYLPSFHRSIRKSQKESPKFYFFDNGVKKALERSLDSKPSPSTAVYGELFEAYIIQEVFRINQYFNLDWRLSFFQTKNNVEVDLVLTKGRSTILIEIKSYDKKNPTHIDRLNRLNPDFKSKAYLVSRDILQEKVGQTECLYWKDFLVRLQKKEI